MQLIVCRNAQPPVARCGAYVWPQRQTLRRRNASWRCRTILDERDESVSRWDEPGGVGVPFADSRAFEPFSTGEEAEQRGRIPSREEAAEASRGTRRLMTTSSCAGTESVVSHTMRRWSFSLAAGGWSSAQAARERFLSWGLVGAEGQHDDVACRFALALNDSSEHDVVLAQVLLPFRWRYP